MSLSESFSVTSPFSLKDTFLRLHPTGGLHPACCTNAKWIGITVLNLLQFLDHPVLVKLNPPKSDRSYLSSKFDLKLNFILVTFWAMKPEKQQVENCLAGK